MAKKKQSRRSISVRKGTYAHLQEIGATRHVSISDFVEEALKHYCVHLGLCVPPPAVPGVHKPAPKMAAKMAARARAEALGVVQPAAAPVVREMPPVPPAPAVNVVLPVREACAPTALRPAPPVTVAPPLPPARSSIRWMTARELARALGLPPVMVRRALARLETQQRILRDKDRVRASDLAILDARNGTIRPIDNASRIIHLLAQPKADEASKPACARQEVARPLEDALPPTPVAGEAPRPNGITEVLAEQARVFSLYDSIVYVDGPPVVAVPPAPVAAPEVMRHAQPGMRVRPFAGLPRTPVPTVKPVTSALDTRADRVLATATRDASTVML